MASFAPTVMRWSVLGALALGWGCNWTKFSDDADKAPVRSIAAPSGFDSADFGKSITPLGSGQGSAAAFIATSINGTHMTLVKIDRSGHVSSFPVSDSALAEVDGSAVTSAAELPGSVPTTLLLGSPLVRNATFGRLYTYALPDPSLPGVASGTGDAIASTFLVPALGSADSGLGRGLAAGRLGGVEGTPDYIVGSDNQVAVVIDGVAANSAVGLVTVGVAPAPACEVAYDIDQDNRYALRRPMMAARLWADPAGPTVQQLFVGSTHGTGAGTVSIMNVTSAPPALNCLASIKGTKPQFGHALAAGDVDGDGVPDFLVVGAPGQQAFVYMGWAALAIGSVPATPLPIMPVPAGVDFGFAVATLDVDGIPGDEVLVSDPRATVGGQAGAGHVLVYKYNATTATMDQIGEYADHSPESDANFGYTLSVLNFCTADPAGLAVGAACPAASVSRILMIGAANETFVYFRVGENIPLQAGQTVPDVRTP